MACKKASEAKARRALACPRSVHTPIINHHSSIIDARGFTLIELLVVISIVVLLVAILLPTLSRARKQARAVACQSKLRQWALVFCAYTDDHNGRFFPWWPPGYAVGVQDNRSCHQWPYAMRAYFRDCNDLLLCPAATRPRFDDKWGNRVPDAFGTWEMSAVFQSGSGVVYSGSYGLNAWIGKADHDDPIYRAMWNTLAPVPSAGRVPLLFDCMSSVAWYRYPERQWSPPPCQGATEDWNWMNCACIDRHNGGVNHLFLDWSVRKVGLKELWTLKWHKHFETAGPWTKAGGVRPEDWPPWMRGFKDY